MKVERFLVAAGVNAANDELDSLVINRTLQRNALAGSETVKYDELAPDNRALPVIDKGVPVGVRHFYFRDHFSQLARVHGEVREKVLLIFVDAAKPTERHHFLDAGHGLHLLHVGHRDDESQRDCVTRDESQRAGFFGAAVKLSQDRGQTDDQKE